MTKYLILEKRFTPSEIAEFYDRLGKVVSIKVDGSILEVQVVEVEINAEYIAHKEKTITEVIYCGYGNGDRCDFNPSQIIEQC